MIKTSIITAVSLIAVSAAANAAPIYSPIFKPESGKFTLAADAQLESGSVILDGYYGIGNRGWVHAGYAFGQNDSWHRNSDWEVIGGEFLTIGAGYRVASTNMVKFDLKADANIDVIETKSEESDPKSKNSSNIVIGAKLGLTPSENFIFAVSADYRLDMAKIEERSFIVPYDPINISDKYLGLTADAAYKLNNRLAVGIKFTYNAMYDKETDAFAYATTVYGSYSAGGIDFIPYFAMYDGDNRVQAGNNMTMGIKIGMQF